MLRLLSFNRHRGQIGSGPATAAWEALDEGVREKLCRQVGFRVNPHLGDWKENPFALVNRRINEETGAANKDLSTPAQLQRQVRILQQWLRELNASQRRSEAASWVRRTMQKNSAG
jgi:hypothetical protein